MLTIAPLFTSSYNAAAVGLKDFYKLLQYNVARTASGLNN